MTRVQIYSVAFAFSVMFVIWALISLNAAFEELESSRRSHRRCLQYANQIELANAKDEQPPVRLASTRYNPGSNLMQAMKEAGIPQSASFGLMKTPPRQLADSKVGEAQIDLPPVILTIPQVVKFVTALDDTQIPHFVRRIGLTAANPEDSTAGTSNSEPERWDCQLEIFYYVDLDASSE